MSNIARGCILAAMIGSGSSAACAQSTVPVEINPPMATVDKNGVDMTSVQARIALSLLDYPISPNSLPLSMSIVAPAKVPHGTGVGGADFQKAIGTLLYTSMSYLYWAPLPPNNQISVGLVIPGANGSYDYFATQSDGSIIGRPDVSRGADAPIGFAPVGGSGIQHYSAQGARTIFGSQGQATQTIFPDGEKWDFLYNTAGSALRLKFLISSRGYGVQFSYAQDYVAGGTPPNPWVSSSLWHVITKATFFNRANTYCDPGALVDCPSLAGLETYAAINYDNTDKSIVVSTPGNRAGVKFKFGATSLQMQNVSVPGSTRTYGYSGEAMGSYVGPTGSYSYTFWQDIQEGDWCPCSGSTNTVRNNSQTGNFFVISDINSPYPDGYYDELDRATEVRWMRGKVVKEFKYDGLGGYSGLDYEADFRGNIKKQMRVSSAAPPLTIFTKVFPTECLNPKTCNKPISVADAKGNLTSYSYSGEHGGVLSETGPAVDGVSPVKRYVYGQRYAWIKNSPGAFVHAGDPIWVLVAEKTCRTTSTNVAADNCAGGSSDETIVNYEYGPDTGLAGNNLLLRGKAVTADGVTLRTCYGYDEAGNKIWETSPRAGLANCN